MPMIIKGVDQHAAELAVIERLLLSEPAQATRNALQAERSTLLEALKPRRDACCYLDNYFCESDEWAVIHDLQLEMGSHAAHFDHLLIGRQLETYVIDSRYYYSGLACSDGEQGESHHDVPPLQRAARQIRFLRHYLEHNGLLPSRLGVNIRPLFRPVVLLAPLAPLSHPANGVTPGEEVMRADRFLRTFARGKVAGMKGLVGMARQVSTATLRELSTRLAQRHLPRSVDYAARYGLKPKAAVL